VSGLVDRASRQSVEAAVESSRDLRKEFGRENGVVVREGDEVCADLAESRVARVRKPSVGAQPDDFEISFPQDRLDSIVPVLVDEQHAKGAICLRLEGGKQALELADAVDGRDDQVE
jgi:hypothetical protein